MLYYKLILYFTLGNLTWERFPSKKKLIPINNLHINFFVKEYELVGINGIDFIISDEIYFLEINARITQTSFLYNNFFKDGYV